MLESGHFLFNVLLWQIVFAAAPQHGAALFLGLQLSILIDLDHSVFPQVGRLGLPEKPPLAPAPASGDAFYLSTAGALSQQYHLLHYYRVLFALPFLLLALALYTVRARPSPHLAHLPICRHPSLTPPSPPHSPGQAVRRRAVLAEQPWRRDQRGLLPRRALALPWGLDRLLVRLH
jgi:hypothetical protein